MKKIGIVFLLLLAALAVRLGYLQLIRGRTLAEEAVSQRWVEADGENRGEFLDRHFCPITGAEEEERAFFVPSLIDDPAAVYRSVREFCDIGAQDFLQKIQAGRPFSLPLTEEADCSETAGVEFYSVPKRIGSCLPAEHLIGYCNQGDGATGLEAAFDGILRGGGGRSVGMMETAAGDPMTELRVIEDPEQQKNIRLTLDLRLQNIAEEVIGRRMTRGAAVLLEIDSGDVLAMASVPRYDPKDISAALKADDGALVNRALCAYDAGSVFKIVVAACALEQGVDPGEYDCEGAITVDGRKITCYHETAHGRIGMEEAFAKSCNCYFIKLGEQLGSEAILQTAQKFGIGTPYRLFENSGEQTDGVGKISDYRCDGDVANLSIGQGKVLLTPLRAAQLSAIVAADGMCSRVNLTESVTDGEHHLLRTLSKRDRRRVLSAQTAQRLKAMMYLTTAYGTAQKPGFDAVGGVCCKTGTAQTGWERNGETMTHSWITGFFPAQSPSYALCVFVENGENEGIKASEIFEEIVLKIFEKGD